MDNDDDNIINAVAVVSFFLFSSIAPTPNLILQKKKKINEGEELCQQEKKNAVYIIMYKIQGEKKKQYK